MFQKFLTDEDNNNNKKLGGLGNKNKGDLGKANITRAVIPRD